MTVSRNDPCPCGSGLKYKKCCLGSDPPSKVRARRNLQIAWSIVAIMTLAVALRWGTPVGAAVGLGGAALVGAWTLMHDSSEATGAQSGGILGTTSSKSGATDPRSRSSNPPGSR